MIFFKTFIYIGGMNLDMNKKLTTFLLFSFIFCLGFSRGYSATFILDSSFGDIDDFFWQSTDEYSPYLTYTNVYDDGNGDCTDLRSCYADDTNSGSPDHSWVKTNIFNDPSLATPSEFTNWEGKISDVDYTTFLIYYNSSNSKYAVVNQIGTTLNVWDDLTLQNKTCITDPTPTTYLANDYYLYIDSGDYTNYRANCMYYFNNSEISIFLINNSATQLGGHGVKSHWAFLVSHDGNTPGEIGVFGIRTESSGSGTYTEAQAYLRMTNNTDYSSQATFGGDSPTFKEMETMNYKFLGFRIYQLSASTPGEIRIFPRGSNYGLNNYRSVSLPLCEDIFYGNTQTDFYNDGSYWYRECSGYVPDPEAVSCECEKACLVLDNDYEYYSGTCASGSIISTGYETSASCQILYQYNYPFIVPVSNYTMYVNETGYDYITWRDVNYTDQLPVPLVVDYIYTQYIGYANATEDDIWIRADIEGGVGYGLADYGVLYGSASPCVHLDYGDVVGIFAFNETSGNLFEVPESAYWFPSTQRYANAYYKVKAYPSYSDCVAETNPLLNTNITDKELEINYQYRVISEYGTGCAEYEDSCIPICEEGYTYDPEDIICVGLSCFAFGEETYVCGDGTCDWDLGETDDNCAEDCEAVITPDEVGGQIGVPIATAMQIIYDVFETGFGWDEIITRAVLWTMVSIIMSVFVMYFLGRFGVQDGKIALGTFLAMYMLGGLTGWLPLWIVFVFIVIAGMLFIRQFQSFVGG